MERAGDQVTLPSNLLHLPAELPAGEVCELLLQRPGIRMERILSTGQASPAGFWYDQAEDEWVAGVPTYMVDTDLVNLLLPGGLIVRRTRVYSGRGE